MKNRRTRLLAILLAVIMVVSLVCTTVVLVPSSAVSAETAFKTMENDSAANASQVVLFVEFSDTTDTENYDKEFPHATADTYFGYEVRQLNGLDSTGEDSAVQKTFRNYIYTISDGAKNVVSYFPQMYNDGKYLHIRCNISSRDYIENYANYDSQLIQQALNQMNTARPDMDVSLFDKDNDGAVDNLMLVALLEDNTGFASHAGTAPQATIGSSNGTKSVFRYTVVDGGVNDGSDSFNPSIAIHEYLHTVGAADLYRNNGSSGNPVGAFDMMSAGGLWSWPLVATRERLGWTDIASVNLNNLESSYTLYSPIASGGEKKQALKLSTPKSSTEYFVLEYRQRKPIPTKLTYDDNVYSSGLIVYRVNEKFADEGNAAGNDYVYIFRPGETGLRDSAGEIKRAGISAGDFTTQGGVTYNSSIGSTDLTATITDGAICYSDGTNSGIKITATAQESDHIEFTIEYSADSDGWDTVEGYPQLELSIPTTSTATDGTNFYATFDDYNGGSNKYNICRFNGESWQSIRNYETQGDRKNIQLVCKGDVLYACSLSSEYRTYYLEKYENGAWTTVATLPITAQYQSQTYPISVVGDSVYMLANINNGSSDTVKLYKLEGNSLVQCGGDLPSNLSSPTVVNIGGAPAVVAGQTSSRPWTTDLYRLSGNQWNKTNLIADSAANSISTAVMNGKTYVLANANMTLRLFTFNQNGTLEKTETLPSDIEASQGCALTATEKNLYIAASGSNETYVYAVPDGDLSKLEQLGSKVYNGSYGVSAAPAGDKLYVSIPDNTAGSVEIRSHKLLDGDRALIDLSDATVTLNPTTFDYDGTEKKPTATVTLNGKTLTENTDYEIAYSDNINVGTGKVTVTGKGNYTGTATATFTIKQSKVDISTATVTLLPTSFVFDGTEKKPTATVTLNGKNLTENTDYEITYSDNINVGTGKVTVTGKGSYTGTAQAAFTITQSKVDISKASVTLSPASIVYDGSEKKPTAKVVLNGKTLSTADYSVTYTNNVNAGTATAAITGIGGYTGTVKKTFKISPLSIATAGKFTFSKVPDMIYKGSGLYPTPVVKYGSRALKLSTDYILKYSNNGRPGQASVTVYGNGNFTGKYTISFYIYPNKAYTPTAVNQSNGIKLTWKATVGANRYIVYRRVNNGSWVKIADVGATYYTDTAARTNGARYSYRICAYLKSIATGGYTMTSNTGQLSDIRTAYYLQAPTITYYGNRYSKCLTARWNRNAYATGYVVLYRTGTQKTSIIVSGNTNIYRNIHKLQKGKTYAVYVRSFKRVNGVTYYSPWSAGKTVRITK